MREQSYEFDNCTMFIPRWFPNALGGLSENQRAALVFQHYDGLALEDIAQIMNQSVSATKSLLHRARANLREALEPYKEQEND